MKSLIKIGCLFLGLLFVQNNLFSQKLKGKQDVEKNTVYIGLGMGFDHGGLGVKAEYLPIPHLGLFAGIGYDFLSLGVNVGVAVKILPQKKVCPNFLAFYGYNGVFKGADSYASQYNMTSYGFTVGANMDIKLGKAGNKLVFGLFVPFRSEKFKDNYDSAKQDSNLVLKNELLPVAFSAGFNFRIH